MTTLTQVVKTIVENSIDRDYIVECGDPITGAATLASIYEAEYGYNGKSPAACRDYLQGLPSVCTIPFQNYEILEVLATYGISRKSDDDQYNLINAYWETAGQVFYKFIK